MDGHPASTLVEKNRARFRPVAYRAVHRRGARKVSRYLSTQEVGKLRSSLKKHDMKVAYLMLTPIVVLLTIFVVIPLIYAMYVSFYQWSFYKESVFVGWQNFERVWNDSKFWGSIWVGIKFVFYTVPAGFILAFLFAHVVKSLQGKLGILVKTSIYVPNVVSGVVASIIFIFIYDYQGGLANYLISLLGFEHQAWTSDMRTAMLSIAIPAVWLGFGYTTLIMLAGLNDIPASYYEAAEIDGAGWWTKMFYITIPMMKNVFLFVVVTGTVGAIQQFDLPYMMTGGGPLNTTMTPNLFIFNHFRGDPYLGYTIASALLLFLIVGFISSLMFRAFSSDKAIDS